MDYIHALVDLLGIRSIDSSGIRSSIFIWVRIAVTKRGEITEEETRVGETFTKIVEKFQPTYKSLVSLIFQIFVSNNSIVRSIQRLFHSCNVWIGKALPFGCFYSRFAIFKLKKEKR